MKTSPGPIREDSHYARTFNMINQSIWSWVPEITEECNGEVSVQGEKELLRILKSPEFDPHGTRTARLLSKNRFKEIVESRPRRMALVRHCIALFLWAFVFRPLAFGLSEQDSERQRRIEGYMIRKGRKAI